MQAQKRPFVYNPYFRAIYSHCEGQNNFWYQNAFLTCSWRFVIPNELEQLYIIQIGTNNWDLETYRNKPEYIFFLSQQKTMSDLFFE